VRWPAGVVVVPDAERKGEPFPLTVTLPGTGLKDGDVVTVRGPSGDYFLNPKDGTPQQFLVVLTAAATQ